MITSEIGPFARPGSRIDVTVSSIGDAKSLQGGVLLQVPLQGADRTVYAVAQGAIAVGGFLGGTGGAGGATVQKNHPTVATIPNGAIVEREIPSELVQNGSLNLMLREADYTSSARMAEAINRVFLTRPSPRMLELSMLLFLLNITHTKSTLWLALVVSSWSRIVRPVWSSTNALA